jgi:hypothetical protein
MKTTLRILISSMLAIKVAGAVDTTYTNFIWQRQLPNGAEVSMNNLPASDEQYSPLGILPDGARFELWTTSSSPLASYLLQSVYVGTYVPQGSVVIDTEDPWGKEPDTTQFTNVTYANPSFVSTRVVPVNTPAKIRRTRADRPFKVYVTTNGLLNGATDPDPSKAVNFYHHIQSYGPGGTGNPIDRTQATAVAPGMPQIATNGVFDPIVVNLTTIAGADRTKIRGEERYSIFSLEDNQDPSNPIAPNELASQYVQIWPMSDGSISGIGSNQIVRFAMPKVTFVYNDTYPGSQTFAQIYKGEMRDNVDGLIVPGSHKNNTNTIPESYTELTGGEFDRIFEGDGRWTMEVLTITPFDTIRLAYVSFTLDRTIEVNASVTTIE